MDDYQRFPGLGVFATEWISKQMFIGWTCLKYLDDTPEIELGYRYLTEYWGMGIATEASRALLHYGFNTLGVSKIVGITLPQNLASIRVLTKLGFTYVRRDHYYNKDVNLYELENNKE